MAQKINLPTKLIIFSLFVSIFTITSLCYGISPCQAEASDSITPVLVVSATGTTTTAPDQARISLAVANFDKQLDKAQTENNATTQSVISALRQGGIKDNCIQTINYNVYPQYNYSDKPSTEPQIIGYRVTNEISVVVKDIDRLGHVLDIAVKAGANNINYVTFEKSDLTACENEALTKAIARAREKAQAIVGAAGLQLGKIISINEGGTQYISPRNSMYLQKDESMGSSNVPVVPGNLTINGSVTVTYELI